MSWKKPRYRGARTSTHVIISFKRGTDVRAAEETVRVFAAEHPHAHLVVCAPGQERALNVNPRQLQMWRERLAELARERGIRMQARAYPDRHRAERHVPHKTDRAARRTGGPAAARRARAERLARAVRSKQIRAILTRVRKERERRAQREARAFVHLARETANPTYLRLAAGRLRELEQSEQRRVAPAQYFTQDTTRAGPLLQERLCLLQDIYRDAGPTTRQVLATLRRETTQAYRQEQELER